MCPSLQPKKVWKHFYAPDEHWERIASADPVPLRRAAEDIVGRTREEASELPRVSPDAWGRVRAVLADHHEAAYGPAYFDAVRDPESCWSLRMGRGQRHVGYSPRGVYFVVQLDRPASWVMTAYRPHPPIIGVDSSEAGYLRAAEAKFAKETGMDSRDAAGDVVARLEEASRTAPANLEDLWWLAAAVGHGRFHAEDPAVVRSLSAAERRLAEVERRLADALRRSLDWSAVLQGIRSGVKDVNPFDLETALHDAEDLLVVASVMGAVAEAEAFLEQAETLLGWIPAEWVELGDVAARRAAAVGGADHVAGRLWIHAEEAALGAALRDGPASVRPAARLVDALVPAVLPWDSILLRIALIGAGMAAERRACRERWASTRAAVALTAPKMGASGDEQDLWDVRLTVQDSDREFVRVFVVDAAHPEGHEDTEFSERKDEPLWRLEGREDRALIVVVASDSRIEGTTLDEVLSEAERRRDIIVTTKEVSPPT